MSTFFRGTPYEDLSEITSIIGRDADEVKRAHRAADQLQHDLFKGSLTNRVLLGTEPEIRERYGLGRWACREAISILELRGIAKMRVGRGGGLEVASPSVSDLANQTLLHLSLKRGSTRELVEARRIVCLAALRRVIERGGDFEELLEMRRQRAQPHLAPATRPSFLGWLADLTCNAAFGFLVDFVETLCDSYLARANPILKTPRRCAPREEEALWRAICRHNLDEAREALDVYLAATERLPLDTKIRVHQILDAWPSKDAAKSARRVAIRLVDEIIEASPDNAFYLGTETDIGLRHNANAEIVRQAIRLLEDLGIAIPRRGRHGGLELRQPDEASIICLIPHILIQDRLKISDCFEAAGLLKVEMAKTAATIGKAERGLKMKTTLSAVRRNPGHLHAVAFEREILHLLDNSVLTACERGFFLYTCNIEPMTKADAVPVAIVKRISALTSRVIERILDGDVQGAEAAALEKHRVLALRFAPSPTGLPDDSTHHPLSVVSEREQELLWYRHGCS